MSPPPLQTWLLPSSPYAPSTFPPIGSLIASPLHPTTSLLSELPPPHQPPTATTHLHAAHAVHSTEFSSHASIFSRFCQVLHLKLSAETLRHEETEYSVESLETVVRTRVPGTLEVERRMKEEAVKEAMRGHGLLGLVGGHRAVYMVTGIKIARGFRRSTRVSGHRGIQVGLTGPKGAQYERGSEWEVSGGTEQARDEDVVVAYQLFAIAHRGWRHERVSVDVYVPKYGVETWEWEDGEEEEEVFEMGMAGVGGDLGVGSEGGSEGLVVKEAVDEECFYGDGTCVVVHAKEE